MTDPIHLQNPMTPLDTQVAKEWDSIMQHCYNAQRITDPKLLEMAESYAKRLKVKTPLLYVAEEFPAMFGGKMPNALAHPALRPDISSAIAFTKQKFASLNYQLHSASAVPGEVLFTLGHEMGHIKQGGKYIEAIRKYPPLIGAAAIAGGIFLLDMAIARTKKHQKDDAVSDEKILSTLEQVSEEEHAKIKALVKDASGSQHLQGPLAAAEVVMNSTVKAGEYLMAAALGFVGGKFATRDLMLKAEFQADETGARLCGDPRAGVRSIRHSQEYIKNMPLKERALQARKITPKDIAAAYFEHAHPTDAQRILRLEELAVEMDRYAGKMSRNVKAALGAVLDRAPGLLSKLSESLHGVRIH